MLQVRITDNEKERFKLACQARSIELGYETDMSKETIAFVRRMIKKYKK